MKKLIKSGLQRVAHHLPLRVRNAMLEQFLCDTPPWDVLTRIAPLCGISALKVDGAYGRVQSAPTDDTILRTYAESGTWARRTNDLLCRFFAGRGGSYLDIGANIGLTTIPVAGNSRVRCIAIEPDPTNFSNLVANVRDNCPHANVRALQKAAFNRRATLAFELAPTGNLGDHRLRLEAKPGRLGEEKWKTIEVDAAPLDELVGDLQGPVAVKMDTQGAEPFVVAGATRVLEQTDLLITEWSPYWMARLGGDPEVVVRVLRRHFTRLSLAEGEDPAVPSAEPVDAVASRLLELAARHSQDPYWYLDVIALTDAGAAWSGP